MTPAEEQSTEPQSTQPGEGVVTPAADAPADDSLQYTPQQAIQHSRALTGQPAWLVEQALTKAGLMSEEWITTRQISQAVDELLAKDVPTEPLPGAATSATTNGGS